MEVHSRGNQEFTSAGYLNGNDASEIFWQPLQKIEDKGNDPAVTTDGDWIIGTWNSNNELRYSVARVP
jgi:hypothetical protein